MAVRGPTNAGVGDPGYRGKSVAAGRVEAGENGRARRIGFVSRVLLAGLLGLAPADARAVAISGADGFTNTNAPPGGYGWSYTSENGGGTGVYIGNSWVLTAAHVGSTLFVGPTGLHWAVSGSDAVLTNADGTSSDLLLFRIQGDPGLPPLSLRETPLPVAAPVVAIGRGFDRGAAAAWTTNGGTWVQVDPAAPHDCDGYLLNNTRRVTRWGTNLISDNNQFVELDAYGTISFNQSFLWSFDAVGTDGECQAVPGDSGGGVFTDDGSGGYALAGIIYARDTFAGQPSASAVYGNTSYAIDVSAYFDQIAGLTGIPEPSAAMLSVLGFAVAWRVRSAARRCG